MIGETVDYGAARRLAVVATYDGLRRLAGHDYGCGQRWGELVRLRQRTNWSTRAEADRLELELRAFERIGREFEAELGAVVREVLLPRRRRAVGEDYRRHTPATARTLATLERLLVLGGVSFEARS